MTDHVTFGEAQLTIEQVVALSQRSARAQLQGDAAYGVKIAKGATVKNCVIMQDARIDEGVYLENCILDKQAHIQKDGRLIGPKSYPIVISKNMVI